MDLRRRMSLLAAYGSAAQSGHSPGSDGQRRRCPQVQHHLALRGLCHTCSSQCANSIDVAAVMDALRQLAIRDGIAAPEMDIFRFHKYIYGSIERHERLNKLAAMVQFKVGSGRLFSDLQAGLKMITRGKLERLPQKVADRNELDRILTHYDRRRRSFAAMIPAAGSTGTSWETPSTGTCACTI
jgi:L-lactate utilization protein LutB